MTDTEDTSKYEPAKIWQACQALRHGLRNVDKSKRDAREAMHEALALLEGTPIWDPVAYGDPTPGRVAIDMDDGTRVEYQSNDLRMIYDHEVDHAETDPFPGDRQINDASAFMGVIGVCTPDENGTLMRVELPKK